MKNLKTQDEIDARINKLHREAMSMWPKIEEIIDELKALGEHSLDRDNALLNTREWLDQLSKR
jgi:uncharacterized coiled-coil DUF342 family protein